MRLVSLGTTDISFNIVNIILALLPDSVGNSFVRFQHCKNVLQKLANFKKLFIHNICFFNRYLGTRHRWVVKCCEDDDPWQYCTLDAPLAA